MAAPIMTQDEQKVLMYGALGFLAFLFLTGGRGQQAQAQGYSIAANGESKPTCLPCAQKAVSTYR